MKIGTGHPSSLKDRNIVIFLWSLELGGAERQAILLGNHLKNGGAHVTVFAFTIAGLAAELCDRYELPWQVLDKPFNPHSLLSVARATFKVVRTLKRHRADIVIAYTTPPNVVCSFAWRLAGVKAFIWSQRSNGIEAMWPFDAVAAKYFAPWFISNSREGADYLVRSFGVQPGRCRIIQNGVELDKPKDDRTAWRKRLGIGKNDFVACMVANLHQDKDHATLLKAWSIVVPELRSVGMNAVLVLAGKLLSSYPSLKHLTLSLRLERNVIFLGQTSDVPGLLNAADISVLTSLSEGLPNSVLESMASGLPVVGSDIKGIEAAVGAQGTPYLAPVHDENRLAAIIVQLACHPAVRRELGVKNRQRIVEHFTPEKMCRDTERYINDILRSFPSA